MTIECKVIKQETYFNYNIDLLKIIFSFIVVMNHFGKWSEVIQYILPLAVPMFVIISFFLSNPMKYSCIKLKKRIKRLIIPLWSWSLIYYIIFNVFQEIPLIELMFQIFFGNSSMLAPPLYYLVDMLFLILILYSLKSAHSKNIIFIILCSLAMEYSGLNFYVFSQYRREIRYTLGRIIELLPYAVIGITIRNSWEDIFSKMSTALITGGGYIFYICYRNKIVSGFGYQSLSLLMVAISITLLSLKLKLSPKLCKILRISRYSMGIFCTHFGVGRLIVMWLNYQNIYLPDLLLCILIWIISLTISVLLAKTPLKILVC